MKQAKLGAETQAKELGSQLQEALLLEPELRSCRAMLLAAEVDAKQSKAEAAGLASSQRETQLQLDLVNEQLVRNTAALEVSRHDLNAMTGQCMTTKQNLISTAKQLAAIAKEHNQALEKMGSSDERLVANSSELEEAKSLLAFAQHQQVETAIKLQQQHEVW